MNILDKIGFTKKGVAANNQAPEKEEPAKASVMTFIDDTPRQEGETRIHNLIILDESGSMGSIYEQAFTGANETIQVIRNTQNENPDDHQMLTFVTFDSGSKPDDVRAIISCKPISEVSDITKDMYQPNGCTPLYDAMGISISALKKVVADGDNVLVTVITDGFENSSRLYSASMVKELVEALRTKGWVFTYIGANQDSVETAGELGIRNSMDFACDARESEMMWRKMQSSHRYYYKKVRASKCDGANVNLEEDFFAGENHADRITPERIVSLRENEIFVFGSNLEGQHAGGAARIARESFGAIMGQGVGLQGQSYAIPTMQGGVETIKPYVDDFIRYADCHPELTFLVTRIGCGIAGFRDSEIAPLFASAYSLPNIHLPESFWKVLNYRYNG